jgi:hypothetical protein
MTHSPSSPFTPTELHGKTAASCLVAAHLTMEQRWRESVDDLFL